jgi:hypothetical protein
MEWSHTERSSLAKLNQQSAARAEQSGTMDFLGVEWSVAERALILEENVKSRSFFKTR